MFHVELLANATTRRKSEVTIAETLKKRGYYTAHIGKWHLGRDNGMAPHDQGFDDSLLMTSGLYLPEDDPGVVNAKLSFDPIDRFLWAGLGFAASYNSGDADPSQSNFLSNRRSRISSERQLCLIPACRQPNR